MTRINLISPTHLTQRHLSAEYKEITHFLWCIKRRVDNRQGLADIPKKYTLNKGHCLFFYDKGKYISDRLCALKDEILSRQGTLNIELFHTRRQKILDTYPDEWYNDYQPDEHAFSLVIRRIGTRIEQKPHLYPDADRFFKNIYKYGVVYEPDKDLKPYYKP